MDKKLIILAVLALVLVPLFASNVNAIADKGFQVGNEDRLGYVLDYPKIENYKLGENITFNVHIFDAVTGRTMTNETELMENLTCIMHFYNASGVKIREDVLQYDYDFDFFDVVSDANITSIEGIHPYRIWCGVYEWTYEPRNQTYFVTGVNGSWVSSYFYETSTGKAPPTMPVVFLMYLMFLIILGLIIYAFVTMLIETIKLSIGINDILINAFAFFALFVFYLFNQTYVGVAFINDIFTGLLWGSGIMNIILPPILFGVVTTLNLISKNLGEILN
jgi:hypothetical protein